MRIIRGMAVGPALERRAPAIFSSLLRLSRVVVFPLGLRRPRAPTLGPGTRAVCRHLWL